MPCNKQKIVHPLFAYTVAFALGILAKYAQLNFIIILLIIILSICLSLICFITNQNDNKKYIKSFVIIFFSLGILRFYIWEKQNLKITEMLKTPSNYTAQVLDISAYPNRFFKNKILLKLKSDLYSTKFNINLYVPNLDGIRISDELAIRELKINQPKSHQGSFYSNESIIPKLFASKLLFSILYRPKFSIFRSIKEAKYDLAQNLSKKMSKMTSTLFEYIFLGLKNTSDLSDKLRYKFNYWGIAHYLARSGLHVVMIIFLWSIFLRIMPINFVLKQLILTALSIIYSLLSWPSTSFERAIVTFLLVQACLIMKWPIRSSYLITLCSLFFLIINPFQLFFLDFQLSFGLALGISFFNELQNKRS